MSGHDCGARHNLATLPHQFRSCEEVTDSLVNFAFIIVDGLQEQPEESPLIAQVQRIAPQIVLKRFQQYNLHFGGQ